MSKQVSKRGLESDNRYWTMWKLPMFGCTDASQVLKEIAECRKAYPQCYVRLVAFEAIKQVQVISLVVQRPAGHGMAMAAVSGEKEMKVWSPVNNKKFETFSYLPPLSDAQISKQVDMIITKSLAPCLEFAAPENSFTTSENCSRFSGTSAGYYDQASLCDQGAFSINLISFFSASNRHKKR